MTTTVRVSAAESQRLLRSLQTAGWPLAWLERFGGFPKDSLSRVFWRANIAVERRDAIRVTFQHLRETAPPESTYTEKVHVAAARTAGRRYGGVRPSDLADEPWLAEVLSA